ncbi:MAG: CRTAC1 family protein [Saprospiraceae bacterium]|nr:CRTAC1 family protein [Saprospiraceae bacterium]
MSARKSWGLLITIAVLYILSGCTALEENDPSEQAKYKAEVKPHKSTLEMMKRVKMASSAIDAQEARYVLNQKKVDYYEKKLDKMEVGADRNLVLYDYAIELLRAGHTDKAIEIFTNFHDFFQDKFFLDKQKTLTEFKTQLGISYLRKAEQENCLQNHNNESCIIPISEKAQHINKEGSTKAIEFLKACLEASPFDYEVQYLLNIAYMTLGGYPDQVPEDYLIPESYFQKGDFSKFKDVAMDLGVDVNEMSGGICLDDFNQDGYLDMMVSSWGFEDQIRYFENDTQGGFTDKTARTGLVGVTGGLNLKHADFNNDGFLDFIILRGAWLEDQGKVPNSLIRNNGDGTFTDVTIEAGIYSERPTQTAIWADFNLDGWVDIFIANESTDKGVNTCELFLNKKDGTFSDVGKLAGITETGFFKGVDAGDLNNDGYPDLYLSNFSGKNLLYLNSARAEGISFELASDSAGVTLPLESFSTWIFDYNNDGFEDIFVSGYSNQEKSPANIFMANIRNPFDPRLEDHRPRLYRNNGDGTFTNVAKETGLGEPLTTMGCNYGDLDNDGFLDFYAATGDPSFLSIVPNKMFRNQGGETFEDVTFSGGFGHIQKGHAVGFGDLDMDGDQDIYAVMGGAYEGDNFQNVLFENPIGNQNNWINVQLEGRTSNRSAIGAKIIASITEDGKTRKVYHTVGSGASFGGNSLLAELGLGKAAVIDQLEVIWPNQARSRSVFSALEVNRVIKITEGSESIESKNLDALSFQQGTHQHH